MLSIPHAPSQTLTCLHSAVYVCNDQPADVTVPIKEAARYAFDVHTYCWHTPDDLGGTEGPYSGQLFVQDHYGYNVVVAYGDGNDESETSPSSYTPFVSALQGRPSPEADRLPGSERNSTQDVRTGGWPIMRLGRLR